MSSDALDVFTRVSVFYDLFCIRPEAYKECLQLIIQNFIPLRVVYVWVGVGQYKVKA